MVEKVLVLTPFLSQRVELEGDQDKAQGTLKMI